MWAKHLEWTVTIENMTFLGASRWRYINPCRLLYTFIQAEVTITGVTFDPWFYNVCPNYSHFLFSMKLYPAAAPSDENLKSWECNIAYVSRLQRRSDKISSRSLLNFKAWKWPKSGRNRTFNPKWHTSCLTYIIAPWDFLCILTWYITLTYFRRG